MRRTPVVPHIRLPSQAQPRPIGQLELHFPAAGPGDRGEYLNELPLVLRSALAALIPFLEPTLRNPLTGTELRHAQATACKSLTKRAPLCGAPPDSPSRTHSHRVLL